MVSGREAVGAAAARAAGWMAAMKVAARAAGWMAAMKVAAKMVVLRVAAQAGEAMAHRQPYKPPVGRRHS